MDRVYSPQELGAAIRRQRKATGLTQVKLAGLAGVGTRFVSDLERGKPTVHLGKALRVLQLLGIEVYVSSTSSSSK